MCVRESGNNLSLYANANKVVWMLKADKEEMCIGIMAYCPAARLTYHHLICTSFQYLLLATLVAK